MNDENHLAGMVVHQKEFSGFLKLPSSRVNEGTRIDYLFLIDWKSKKGIQSCTDKDTMVSKLESVLGIPEVLTAVE